MASQIWIAACCVPAHAARMPACTPARYVAWARTSAAEAGERGSFVTASFSLYALPSTVSRTVYVPGGASAPSGEAGVSPGLALISNECDAVGGASCRMSQWPRLRPALAGSA